MKILLAEKSKHLVSALMLLITQIKDSEVKEIGRILNVDKVTSLYKELKKEKPNVLIINGGFVNHKTRDMIPDLEMLCPGMAIMILSTDPELEEKYAETGKGNFILKGNSAKDFYNSMVIFLRKEQKRFLKEYCNN